MDELDEIFSLKPYVPEKREKVAVKIGDKLDHSRFGEGIVTEITGKFNEKCVVDFGSFKKELLIDFAGFKKS